MQPDVMQKILENIERSLAPGDRITLAFQGGEPMLAGLDYFRAFAKRVDRWARGIHVSYALQTNAIHLNEEWCSFLKERNFLVGVSYDLLPDCHDAVRADAAGKPTARRVEQAIALLRRFDIEFNILCTLTNQIARHPQQVWRRILQMDLPYVQFTPCLDELERPGQSIYAVTPRRFASFYNTLFRSWLAEYRAGRYRSVKLFDDVVNYMAFGIRGICGMGGQCSPQLVVEADGTVYPCDFYCLDRYALGNMTEKSIPELLSSDAVPAFLSRKIQMPSLCASCPLASFCGGGCERMRRETCCAGTDDFCGYRDFLTQNLPALQQIVQEERRLREVGHI